MQVQEVSPAPDARARPAQAGCSHVCCHVRLCFKHELRDVRVFVSHTAGALMSLACKLRSGGRHRHPEAIWARSVYGCSLAEGAHFLVLVCHMLRIFCCQRAHF